MKQAVVLIHGIGEQKPMETLRGFVAAVLPRAAEGHEQYWSKPDPMSGLFELRRLQTPGRTKTHFYEYYWAYHVEGTRLSHLGQWFAELLFRRWVNIPHALRVIWAVSWVLMGILLILLSLGSLAYAYEWYSSKPQFGPVWAALLLVTGLVQGFLIYYVGDAARYLSSNPQNVALRQKIRADGVRLLKVLHDSRDYDRIIIVGHSLGSVIGYDIITQLWVEYNSVYEFETHTEAISDFLAEGHSPQPVIRDELFKAAKALSSGSSSEAVDLYRDSQVQGWKEQRRWGNPWRISDFVTLGSPLAHAMLLLARDQNEFKLRQRQRELPTCPPVKDERGFAYSGPNSYTVGDRKFTPLILHHAAPFAVTRWTNIFFPAYLGLFGDIIGGPLREVFGSGIKDVPVTQNNWWRITPASHVAYWKDANLNTKQEARTPAHTTQKHIPQETSANAIDVLKRALDLDGIRKFKFDVDAI